MAKRSVDIVVKAHDRASRQLRGMRSEIGRFGKAIRNLVVGGAILRFGKQLFDLAAKQEEAEKQLDAALTATGQSAMLHGERLRRLASDIQKVTVYGDEFTLGLMKQALNLGVTADKMDGAIKQSIGLANALRMDLNTALRYSVLATQGEFTMLRRYIPALRQTTDATKQLAIVQGVANAGWKQANKDTETARGKIAQLKNEMGDLGEKIGNRVLPVWVKLLRAINDSTKAVEGFVKASDPKTARRGEKRGGTGWRMSFENLIAGAADATGFEQVAANLRKQHFKELDAQLMEEMGIRGRMDKQATEKRARLHAERIAAAPGEYADAARRLGKGAAAAWNYVKGGAGAAGQGVVDWWKYSERKKPEAAAAAAGVRGGLDPMASRFLERMPGTRIDDVARTTAKATERSATELQKLAKLAAEEKRIQEEQTEMLRKIAGFGGEQQRLGIARIPG